MTLKSKPVSPIETDPFQQYIHVSKYSRWIEEEKRRESWSDTVLRYMNHIDQHLQENVGYKLDDNLFGELFDAIYDGEIMPSMRAMMTAGKALRRSGIAAYNCSYTPIDDPRAFDEILYILSHGSGVGFSVESKYTEKLPEVPRSLSKSTEAIVVPDSKEGWAESLRRLIKGLYEGNILPYDTSLVRPKGSPLKTFGGYASGPEPLIELFEFVIETFNRARGRKLRPIEVFDLVCYIGRVIVSGGVRRSALICLSDLEDQEMSTAKTGDFWSHAPQREMANISAVYEEKPELGVFMQEWTNIYNSKRGERGIFNRQVATNQALKSGRRDPDQEWGTNPCGEIFGPPQFFCNLTETVAREDDDPSSLREKVRLATILGTFQSTITNFPYLRDIWRQNAEKERLLGVSITGVFGNRFLNGTMLSDNHSEKVLADLKQVAVDTNAEWAETLGINQSAAITCIKPSGTVSLLNGVSSGLHPWYAHQYIRRVRGNNVEPMTEFMKDYGIPNEPDRGNPENVTVFSFALKAPEGAIAREDISALEHLKMWKRFQNDWCEHNPSITVQIKEDEWLEVAAWIWENFDSIGGLALLPYDTGEYQQAPYEECDLEHYEQLVSEIPDIDWSDLRFYERYDSLDNSRELACAGNACEIVDIVSAER